MKDATKPSKERDVLDVLQDYARLDGRANEVNWRAMHSEFLYSQDSRIK